MLSYFSLPARRWPAYAHLAVLILAAMLLSPSARAQDVQVQNAWVRATVPGQKATGAFMGLLSAKGARLKSVATPVAGLAQVHEMQLEGNIMRMHPLENGLELPAGTLVELKPGGYHLMLMDLKAPLAKDSSIDLTLVFVDAKGVETRRELTLPVRTLPPPATAP